MSAAVVLSAFTLLFVAEMGDKTQLAVMTLACRYPPRAVVAGAFTGFALLNLVAVLVGETLYRRVPQSAVLVVAALLFLFFALRSWREGAGDEGESGAERAADGGGFLATLGLVLVAELGDKTQLAMVALAASTGDPWSIFAGGTLALWAVSALGVVAGRALLARLPRAWVQRGAAVLFAGFGVLALVQAGLDLSAAR
jgi:putative Ca2+/H+ antiporter (TMEM165/GDT1 family)